MNLFTFDKAGRGRSGGYRLFEKPEGKNQLENELFGPIVPDSEELSEDRRRRVDLDHFPAPGLRAVSPRQEAPPRFSRFSPAQRHARKIFPNRLSQRQIRATGSRQSGAAREESVKTESRSHTVC